MSDGEVYRKLAPKPHPDWFWSISGGIDSVAAYLVTREALHENYQKRPVMVYLDTRIGLPLNRIYAEQLADRYDEQLWTLRTEWKFEEHVQENGAPGAREHGFVRNGLKNRQTSKLYTLADDPIAVLGISADESPHRASLPKAEQKDRHRRVYPVHRLTRKERVEIILRSDAPINPLWVFPGIFTDCACMANGDPSELDRVAELFPSFAQRLREIQESIDADGIRDTLGWDGLTVSERDTDQQQLPGGMCGAGCQRKRDPDVVRALKTQLTGGSLDEALAELWPNGRPAPEDRSVQTTTGGFA